MSFSLTSRRNLGKKTPFQQISDANSAVISGLRVAWLMDETGTATADTSGNGINSTSNTGTITNVAGYHGSGRQFAPPSNIVFGSSPIPDPGAFSLSFWFNTTAYPSSGGYWMICRFAVAAGQQFLVMDNTSGVSRFTMTFRNSTQFAWTMTTVTNNAWHHVAATYNNGGKSTQASYAIYLDNVLATSAANAGTAGGSDTVNALGTDAGGSAGPFSGIIDEFLVFNSVLTAAQVTQLYTAKAVSTSKTTGSVYLAY